MLQGTPKNCISNSSSYSNCLGRTPFLLQQQFSKLQDFYQIQQQDKNSQLMNKNSYSIEGTQVLSQFLEQMISTPNVFQVHIALMGDGQAVIKKHVEEIISFLKKIKRWSLKHLLFRGYFPDSSLRAIFSIISHISFQHLKEINVWRCHIESIQYLTLINLSSLQYLWLDDNIISSIKSINKLIVPNLESLSLRGNHISNCEILPYLQAPKLKKLIIEYWREDKIQNQSVTWVAKLPNNHMEEIQFESARRIVQWSANRTTEKNFINENKVLRFQDFYQ